jgi:mannose-1-phosphate guanylyltransferase
MTSAPMPVLVILAGGISRRLWPLADKSFIRFFDEHLFAMQLSRFVKLGYNDIIVIANSENAELIFLFNWNRKEWEMRYYC